jgi:hypothetical protein
LPTFRPQLFYAHLKVLIEYCKNVKLKYHRYQAKNLSLFIEQIVANFSIIAKHKQCLPLDNEHNGAHKFGQMRHDKKNAIEENHAIHIFPLLLQVRIVGAFVARVHLMAYVLIEILEQE